MRAPTLLQRLKFKKLRDPWPAHRQPVSDNQRRDTHVESHLALYSDGGSTPPISTVNPEYQELNTLTHKFTHKNSEICAYFILLNSYMPY